MRLAVLADGGVPLLLLPTQPGLAPAPPPGGVLLRLLPPGDALLPLAGGAARAGRVPLAGGTGTGAAAWRRESIGGGSIQYVMHEFTSSLGLRGPASSSCPPPSPPPPLALAARICRPDLLLLLLRRRRWPRWGLASGSARRTGGRGCEGQRLGVEKENVIILELSTETIDCSITPASGRRLLHPGGLGKVDLD